MEELDLKIFIHHGEYMNQNINGNEELAGSCIESVFLRSDMANIAFTKTYKYNTMDI